MSTPRRWPQRSNAVDIWYAAPDEIRDPDLIDRYLALLSEGERERYGRLMFEHNRQEYLVAHALARTTLSRYADVAPEAWAFAVNAHGRPEIAAPELGHSLRFNLSHTTGMVLVGVTDVDVGVDVEDATRRGETVAIAESFFSPAEVRELRALPKRLQRGRFFDLWTLKEAYIKARGLGLAIPLEAFSFAFDGDAIRIAFSDAIDDEPSEWQFAQLRLSSRHVGAVAVRRGGRQPDYRIEVRKVVPLAEMD